VTLMSHGNRSLGEHDTSAGYASDFPAAILLWNGFEGFRARRVCLQYDKDDVVPHITLVAHLFRNGTPPSVSISYWSALRGVVFTTHIGPSYNPQCTSA